jgi:hypothetical protein
MLPPDLQQLSSRQTWGPSSRSHQLHVNLWGRQARRPVSFVCHSGDKHRTTHGSEVQWPSRYLLFNQSISHQPISHPSSINQSASNQSAISHQSSISHQSLLAWAAFRRGGQLPDEQLEPFHLCPVTSRAMQRAEQDLTFVGSVGSTLYYWWNLPGSLDFRASAHASR